MKGQTNERSRHARTSGLTFLRSCRVWLYLGVFVLLTLVTRVAAFRSAEPRIDQAYFASIVRDLALADHVLPRGKAGVAFVQRLETDDKSAINALGHPVYNSPQRAFYFVSLVVCSGILSIFGYSYSHLVVLSILASALTLIPLTVLFRQCSGATDELSLSAALLYLSSLYAALFSPLGPHNFGVLALVSLLALGDRMMARAASWDIRDAGILGGATLVVAYTHFTNPILAPTIVAAGLISLPKVPVGRRLQWLSIYGAIMCAGLAPVALISVYLHQVQSSFLVFAQVDHPPFEYLTTLPERAATWFAVGGRLFSIPGVIGGVGGVAWMASVTGHRLPALALLVHFCCYCLVPGFIQNGSNTYLRTYNYAIPFLALGLGWVFLQAIRMKADPVRLAAFRLVAIAGIVWHLAVQIPVGGFENRARRNLTDFATDYLDGQGELRPIVSGIERDAGYEPLIFWAFPERFLYTSLAGHTDNVAPSALSSLLAKRQYGEQTPVHPTGGYVVASDGDADGVSQEELCAAFLKIYGSKVHVESTRRYSDSVTAYGAFVSYHVRADETSSQ